MNNKYIDHSIEFDYKNLPKEVQDLIIELENIEKNNGDWLEYDTKFDMLDIIAKDYIRYNKVTEKEYKTILLKYGGIYD